MAHQHNEVGYTLPFMKVHAGKYRTEDKVKNTDNTQTKHNPERLDWIEHGFTSVPTQYRLYGRRFYRSDDPTNSVKALKEGG